MPKDAITRYMTVKEVSDVLTVTVQHVHSLIEKGRLEAVNLALDPGSTRGCWRVSEEALKRFLANRAA